MFALIKTQIRRMSAMVFISIVLAACTSASPSQPSNLVGILHYNTALAPILDGFKTGMADLHYIDGKNVTYVDDGQVANDPQSIQMEVNKLLAAKVSVILTIGEPTTLAANTAVKGTKTAVVFTAFSDPVTRGLVQSVSHPGGNMTGIQRGTTVSQTLEMFQSINPKITKIYVPYNPADAVSVTQVQGLVDIAKTLNLDLSLAEVKTPDEVVTAIKSLSKDTAILLVGVPSLNAGKDAILQAAIAQGIMLGSSSAQSYAQAGALLYFDSDFTALGKQAAGLVDKILQGGNPGDIPIETAETYLAINLKTAQTLGLTIPGNLLQQANSIIR